MTIGATESRNEPFVWVNLEFCELNIDPASKAVYLEIVRRARRNNGTGVCWESVEHIAHWANISVAVAKRSLKQLIEWNMIARESRPGFSSWYTLLDRSLWTAPKLDSPSRKQERGRTKKGGSNLAQVKNELAQIKPSSEITQVRFEVQGGKGGSNLAHPGGSNLAHELDHYELDPRKKELDPKKESQTAVCVPRAEENSEALKSEVVSQTDSPKESDLPSDEGKESVGTESSANLSKKKKAPQSRRKSKSIPDRHPEDFEIWWKGYYGFCAETQCEPGLRKEAAAAWDDLFEDGVVLADLLEGNDWYIQGKKKQHRQKGEAIGVAHGIRYLRDRKWENALTHKRKQESRKSEGEERCGQSRYKYFTPPPEPETPQDYISGEEARQKFEEFQRKLKAAG